MNNKETIQTSAEYLANLCLENAEKHHRYSDEDLVNVTIIFNHFLMDILFTENHLPPKDMEELATLTGKAIHELILTSTGKDMKEIVKNK